VKTQTCDFGYLAAPDEDTTEDATTGPAPGIVLIHDVWGLAEHQRDLARRLAGEGFHVLAINLYRDFPQEKIENPADWIQSLSDSDLLADIRNAAAFLSQHPDSRNRKVAVVGFCMGGMYALLAGCGSESGESAIAAVVPYYGLLSYAHGLLQREGGLDPERKPEEPIEAARNLRCPMLAFFGAEDSFITAQDIESLERSVAGTGQSTECVVYPGAGHAFMNDTREDAYRPEAAKDAWVRMLAFLNDQLA
jgi:carboxymethylenebutenolidase